MDQYKEMREVKQQTEKVLALIEEALKKLNSASNWGLYDILGGGMISSIIKRNRMKDSNQLLHEIESALRKLQAEYGDIELFLPEKFYFDFSTEFFDVWFDNIFTDLSVQSNLKRTKKQLEALQEQIFELDQAVAEALSN